MGRQRKTGQLPGGGGLCCWAETWVLQTLRAAPPRRQRVSSSQRGWGGGRRRLPGRLSSRRAPVGPPRPPAPFLGDFYQLRLFRRAGSGRVRGGGAANKKAGGSGPFAWRRPARSGRQQSPEAPGAGSKTGQAPPRGRRPPAGRAGEASAAGTQRSGWRAAHGIGGGVPGARCKPGCGVAAAFPGFLGNPGLAPQCESPTATGAPWEGEPGDRSLHDCPGRQGSESRTLCGVRARGHLERHCSQYAPRREVDHRFLPDISALGSGCFG